MKKAILISMGLVLLLLLLPSCAAGVSGLSQEEYDKIVNDLAAIHTQIQSLQDDFTEARALIQSWRSELAEVQPPIQPPPEDKEVTKEVTEGKRTEALVYAEYLDILMHPLWKEAELTPRFAFKDDLDWMTELKNRADDIGDAELSNYLEELEARNEKAMNLLWNHCIDRIEKALK